MKAHPSNTVLQPQVALLRLKMGNRQGKFHRNALPTTFLNRSWSLAERSFHRTVQALRECTPKCAVTYIMASLPKTAPVHGSAGAATRIWRLLRRLGSFFWGSDPEGPFFLEETIDLPRCIWSFWGSCHRFRLARDDRPRSNSSPQAVLQSPVPPASRNFLLHTTRLLEHKWPQN